MQQLFLENEKKVLKKLEANYKDALSEINSKIELLMARQDADMQHVIYQVEYQKALKDQVSAILEQLHNNEFETVSEYLAQSYEDGFIGTMYDLQGQGIPLVIPLDQEQVAAAIQHETKLSESLYMALGRDTKDLSKKIAGEISRGISNAVMYSEIARNISAWGRIPMNNAMRIARTESHRIQIQATADAQWKAKANGADVVKQWDAALDRKTRKSHRELDGQIRELDEPFEVNGHKAMQPGGFGRPEEDINCRCALLQRARWNLDSGYTKWDEDAPIEIADDGTSQLAYIPAKNYKDFKEQYNQATERVRDNVQKINDPYQRNRNGPRVIRPTKPIQEQQSFQNASTVDELNAIMNNAIAEKGTVNGYIAFNYMPEMNIDVAKEHMEHFARLKEEYNTNTIYELASRKGGYDSAGVFTRIGDDTGGIIYVNNQKSYITVDRYNERLSKNERGRKGFDGTTLVNPENANISTLYHEFGHSFGVYKQRKIADSEDFWKEVMAVKKDYSKNVTEDTIISDYANESVDEFLAEAFTQAKLYDDASPYAVKVLEIVDKYFKKK